MAQDKIVTTLQFTAVGAGATVPLPHGLVDSQGPLRPDLVLANAGGFSITYDTVNVTVHNTGGAPASVGVFVWALWSGIREIGAAADFTVQPFSVSGGGASVVVPTDNRKNAIFPDGGLSITGSDNYTLLNTFIQTTCNGFEGYFPSGVYVVNEPFASTNPQIAASTLRTLVGDSGDLSVFDLSGSDASATTFLYCKQGATLRVSRIGFQGPASTSPPFVQVMDTVFMENTNNGLTTVVEMDHCIWTQCAAPKGDGGIYRYQDEFGYYKIHNDVGIQLNRDAPVAATAPEGRFFGSRFETSGDSGIAGGFHDIYAGQSVSLLALGADFARAGDPAAPAFGLHWNQTAGGSAEYAIGVACVFRDGVAFQVRPCTTTRTLLVGCVGTTPVGGLGIRTGSGANTIVSACYWKGAGIANVEDNNGLSGGDPIFVGSAFEGDMSTASIYRSDVAGLGVWKFTACDLANTDTTVQAFTYYSRGGTTDFNLCHWRTAPSFAGSDHAAVLAGTMVARGNRLTGAGGWTMYATTAPVELDLWNNYLAGTPALAGDGVIVEPLSTHLVTVQGGGNVWATVGGPTIRDVSGTLAYGTLRTKGGVEAYTIPMSGLVTFTANADTVVLTGANGLTNLAIAGADNLASAQGPLRLFDGLTLSCICLTTGFTVGAGGNFAASAQVAHSAGTRFTLTWLVDRTTGLGLWY